MILSGGRTIPGISFRIPHAAYPGLYGLGDAADSATPSWFDQVPGWIKDIQVAVNTQRLLDLNIQRARSGLPAITSSAVAPTVNFGISPEIQQMILYGGIGLLLIGLVKRRNS